MSIGKIPDQVLGAHDISIAYQAKTGYRPSISTVYRWWQKGIGGVRLASIVQPHKRGSTIKQIDDFIDSVSKLDPGSLQVRRGRPVTVKKTKTSKRLKKHGIK